MDCIVVIRDVPEGNEKCLKAVDINVAVPRNYVTGSLESGDINRDDVSREIFFPVNAVFKRIGRTHKKNVLTKKTNIFIITKDYSTQGMRQTNDSSKDEVFPLD
jgi:hypothetical protein